MNITVVRTQSHVDNTATIEFALEEKGAHHLANLTQKVRNMGDILDIRRTSYRKEAILKYDPPNKKKIK